MFIIGRYVSLIRLYIGSNLIRLVSLTLLIFCNIVKLVKIVHMSESHTLNQIQYFFNLIIRITSMTFVSASYLFKIFKSKKGLNLFKYHSRLLSCQPIHLYKFSHLFLQNIQCFLNILIN